MAICLLLLQANMQWRFFTKKPIIFTLTAVGDLPGPEENALSVELRLFFSSAVIWSSEFGTLLAALLPLGSCNYRIVIMASQNFFWLVLQQLSPYAQNIFYELVPWLVKWTLVFAWQMNHNWPNFDSYLGWYTSYLILEGVVKALNRENCEGGPTDPV